MATAAKRTGTKGTASMQFDAAAKKKIIIAGVMLVLAAALIIYNLMGTARNPNAGPSLSQAEEQKIEETHKQEIKKVIEETNQGYRGGTPPANPSGA